MNCVLYCNPANPKHQALIEALTERGYQVETQVDHSTLRLVYMGRTYYQDEIPIHFCWGDNLNLLR